MPHAELLNRHLPTPMAGLALGIAGLGWALENTGYFAGVSHALSAIIAALILIALFVKFMHYPRLLAQDIAHPIVGSTVPTFAMATMVIAHALSLHHHSLGLGLWLLAVIAHLSVLTLFTSARVHGFRLNHMVPSWFVPPVGIIVACVSFPGGQFLLLANVLFYFGLICYFVMLPIMMYRLIFGRPIAKPAKPTIAILAAPASLSLAGYLTVVPQPSLLLVAILAGIALLMTAIIYVSLFRLMRAPFNPGFSAFTFPLAIGATALFKTAHLLQHLNVSEHAVNVVWHLAQIELVIASVVVGFVCLGYAQYFLSLRQAAKQPLLT